MKKILYLVTQSEYGGAQTYISSLALNLDRTKYDVFVGVGEFKKLPWLEKLHAEGIKICPLHHVVRELNPLHDFLCAFELFSLFLAVKPDIVHLNSSKIGSTGAVMAWLYKKITGRKIKIIYTVHGFVFNEPLPKWRQKFYLWSERISGYFKDKLICVSEHDKIIGLNKKIARHDKFVTIHNGIDLENLKFIPHAEARQDLVMSCGLPALPVGRQVTGYRFIVGTIANLYATKGIEYLIRAAKIIVEKEKNVIFVVVGEGKEREKLEKEIKKLSLEDKFFLVGNVENAAKYLKAFDIFTLSSVKEGFPYTLIEALAAEIPIVSTRVGGIVEIVEPEVNGLIVEAKKPRELAGAIQNLLEDENLRAEFGRNNLEKSKKFDLQKMLEKTVTIYEE